jgi:hypothetical protein
LLCLRLITLKVYEKPAPLLAPYVSIECKQNEKKSAQIKKKFHPKKLGTLSSIYLMNGTAHLYAIQ